MWKNERKAKEKRCVSNKVIYFLPSLCRLQPLKSRDLPRNAPNRGHLARHNFASLSPRQWIPTVHNPWLLTGSPCWKPNYHREKLVEHFELFYAARPRRQCPAATRLRIRNVLIMGTAAQQQNPHKSQRVKCKSQKLQTETQKLNTNNAKYID